ncbi:hypothetical protein EV126DRAFT_408881 [Verticillium dahliae]|nr:hypothetical protein EV126DRAFT_408881 [Verticillium dahliae]
MLQLRCSVPIDVDTMTPPCRPSLILDDRNCPLCFLLTPHETGQARGRARHQRWPKLAPASVQLIIRRPYPRDFPQGFSGATGGGECRGEPRPLRGLPVQLKVIPS